MRKSCAFMVQRLCVSAGAFAQAKNFVSRVWVTSGFRHIVSGAFTNSYAQIRLYFNSVVLEFMHPIHIAYGVNNKFIRKVII